MDRLLARSRLLMVRHRYFELILYKAYADLRAEAERTYIGYLWWVIDPIINMSIFYLVFGVFLQRSTEDYIPFLLAGLTPWRWFEVTVKVGANSILNNAALTRQVDLPKLLFPGITILTNTFKFTIAYTLILIYLWIDGYPPHLTYLGLPVLLAVQLLFITSMAYLLASVIPFIPDLNVLIDNSLRILFYLSAIFYPVSKLPEQTRRLVLLNPMATLIEGYRDVLLYDKMPSWGGLAGVAGLSSVILITGIWLIRRFNYIYPKVIS